MKNVLVVIFGAGASNDARGDTVSAEDRPPLANALLDPAYDRFWIKRFSGVEALVHRVRRDLQRGAPLEQALEAYAKEAEAYPEVLSHLMAFRYYLQALFRDVATRFGTDTGDGTTEYLELVTRLERWRRDHDASILYITFNYDTLLEAALRAYLTRTFEAVGKYIQGDRAVIKVHGSANWAQEVRRSDGTELAGDGPATMIEAAQDGLDFLPTFHVVGDLAQVQMPSGAFVAPALGIPVASKSETSWACPVEHLEVMREGLGTAKAVLVIGWKGQEPHFLKELDRVPEYTTFSIVTRPAPEGDDVISSRPPEWLKRDDLVMRTETYRTGFYRFVEEDYLDRALERVPLVRRR